MLIQTVCWVFVVGLIGSTIYSSLSHIKNFLHQKNKIQNGKVDDIYERIHNQTNWKFLIVIQLVKVSIACLIIFFFFMPLNETDNKNFWTIEIKKEFIAGVKGNKPIKGFTDEQMNEYSNFVLNRVIQEYPDPKKIQDKLPEDLILKIQKEYFNNQKK